MDTNANRAEPEFVTLQRLGEHFECYRLSRNITQKELARQAGVSKNTVVNFEKTGAASLDTVLRILKALDLRDRLFLLVPDAKISPLDPKAGKRQRARSSKHKPRTAIRWGDEL